MTITNLYWRWLLTGFVVVVAIIMGFRYFHHPKPVDHTGLYKIDLSTFKSDSIGGWGFDIAVDHKLLIHQPWIPAIQGKQGFASEDDAHAVGRIFVEQLKKEKVPHVTVQQLIDMGVYKPGSHALGK